MFLTDIIKEKLLHVNPREPPSFCDHFVNRKVYTHLFKLLRMNMSRDANIQQLDKMAVG